MVYSFFNRMFADQSGLASIWLSTITLAGAVAANL